MEDREGKNRRRKLRTGYTTGACAAAAAKAAASALLTQRPVHSVTITLPIGSTAAFKIERCTFDQNLAQCSVLKDAGDDPDVTHGAEICAAVSWNGTPGIAIGGGEGVGVATKPGLGLPIGEPAINPVPRQMISQAMAEVAGLELHLMGLRAIISVPQGREIAKKTLNARLGIVGGISILGTTGIVIPYSTAAYRASISQALDVAVAAGCQHIVLSTGGRSERFAQELLALPEEAFVQMGDFVGFALRECAHKGIAQVTICAMVGKMSKIAAGKMQTHAAGSQVDPGFLAELAAQCGAHETVVAQMKEANTARHCAEIILAYGLERAFARLCQMACQRCRDHIKEALAVECLLVDFDGRILGRAQADG